MKIAVSLPEELVVAARRSVELGLSPSVSALVASALEAKQMELQLEHHLATALEATGGPPTPEEIARIDHVLADRGEG